MRRNQPRKPLTDADVESQPDHDPNTRLLRGRKKGGVVNAALDLARRYMSGGRVKGYADGGLPDVPEEPLLQHNGRIEPMAPPSWLDHVGASLRQRALNGPAGMEMLSQLLMLPLGHGRSSSAVASQLFRPGASFDQRTLSPALQSIYRHGTPAEQAKAMDIWQSLVRREATLPPSPQAAPPSVRNEPVNPSGLTPYQRALDMFNHMDPPSRGQMHASGGRVGYADGGEPSRVSMFAQHRANGSVGMPGDFPAMPMPPMPRAMIMDMPRPAFGAGPAPMPVGRRDFNGAYDPVGERGFAHGGPVVAGPILGSDGGRDDAREVSVKSGSFVIPSDIVSGIPGAGGNTLAGMRILEQQFGKPAPHAMASGGPASDVPIKISSGEFVVTPDQVTKLGGGSLERGHRILEQFIKQARTANQKHLAKLPPPARD